MPNVMNDTGSTSILLLTSAVPASGLIVAGSPGLELRLDSLVYSAAAASSNPVTIKITPKDGRAMNIYIPAAQIAPVVIRFGRAGWLFDEGDGCTIDVLHSGASFPTVAALQIYGRYLQTD